MSPVAITRPYSQNFAGESASSLSQDSDRPALKRPAVRSHYRPYSTLFVDTLEEELPLQVVSHRNSCLVKPRRRSILSRSASLGEAMGLGGKKKLGETEKVKLPTLRIRKLSDISASTPPATSTTVMMSTKTGVSRPNTSAGGATGKEQRNINGRSAAALHRVKAQRSIGSLFTAAAAATDVSPNSAILEHSPRSKPEAPTHPPTALRSRKMDGVVPNRPRTSSNPRQKRQIKVDVDDGVSHRKADNFFDNNIWFTRSRTRVHPYPKEVPYMQAYDMTCLENDRYSELLLERLNPGSPSFHDFGKKPPLSVLDLGCGQGHWVLYAASVWKGSRITGFDLMDITLPAFQSTDNVNFIRGNFLIKLPFPAKSFDYIRMANLSLCIPYDQWLPLLTEVRRILTTGGRLEIIDDQMIFPYGEEPQIKDLPSIKDSASINDTISIKDTASINREMPRESFFDFSDSDSMDDDDDTLEGEASSSTTSTLVSERDSRGFFDKLPLSKRISAQSNASTSVNSVQPLLISVSSTAPLQPTISPSPTVTQATFSVNDPDTSTLSQSPTITGRKQHKKTNSGSSTKSNSDALVSWKSKKMAAMELEVIFEHVLVHKYGIHPRPSEFIVDTMRHIFGKGNAGKIHSYHINHAPFDSPIGPGGSLAPSPKVDDTTLKAEKPDKKHWTNISDKKEKKEKKRERKRLEKSDSAGSSLEENAPNSMAQPAVITAKAASRLGLVPTVPSLPRRISSETSTGSESESSTSSTQMTRPRPNRSNSAVGSGSYFPVVNAKAAGRLGIPVSVPTSAPPPIPPKSAAIRNSYINTGAYPNREVAKAVSTVQPRQRNEEDSVSYSLAITPTASFKGSSTLERDSSSSESAASSDSEKSTSSSDLLRDDQASQPPAISAKAAGRLGISYSVLAAASAANSRSSGVMAPVQSPGLLVWPSTYLPMSPAELEMHSCKHVQTLLGCRHALREFITGDFDGKKLADDADFEEAIWDYECFRRSRFLWPNDNPDLFDDDGFPESPAVTNPTPSRESSRTRGKSGHSRSDSMESFNGQYRRDDLTNVRTIRVFEAVKSGEDKSLVSMLFPSNGTEKPYSYQ